MTRTAVSCHWKQLASLQLTVVENEQLLTTVLGTLVLSACLEDILKVNKAIFLIFLSFCSACRVCSQQLAKKFTVLCKKFITINKLSVILKK
jgi:hypothetical protein